VSRRTSEWYARAVAVIRPALDVLPAGTPRKVARRALRDLYPFGERAFWPYKCWLQAVRDQLDARYGEGEKLPDKGAPDVRVTPDGVVCRFCEELARRQWEGPRTPGCLCCVVQRDRLAAVRPDTLDLWREWIAEARADKDPRMVAAIMADWVEEWLDFPGEAEALRSHGLPPIN
jgi:hypothetical protein